MFHMIGPSSRVKSKDEIRKLFIKTFKSVSCAALFFKQSKKKQLHLKKWFYGGMQPLHPSILQVVWESHRQMGVLVLNFRWGKQRAMGCQSWAQHQNLLLTELARLIFPSRKFQFLRKFDFKRLSTKINFFGLFQLLFIEIVEIMETAV